MMIKFRNVSSLTSFSHFDIQLLVVHLLQIVLRDPALGGGAKLWGATKRVGGGGIPLSLYVKRGPGREGDLRLEFVVASF